MFASFGPGPAPGPVRPPPVEGALPSYACHSVDGGMGARLPAPKYTGPGPGAVTDGGRDLRRPVRQARGPSVGGAEESVDQELRVAGGR